MVTTHSSHSPDTASRDKRRPHRAWFSHAVLSLTTSGLLHVNRARLQCSFFACFLGPRPQAQGFGRNSHLPRNSTPQERTG